MKARTACVAALLSTASLVGGVSAGASSASASERRLPEFYAVPKPLPSRQPGSLVKSQRIKVPGVHGTTYRVMYVSTSQRGKAVAVTGLVIVPRDGPPRGGYPVVTWAHGTDGLADECALSIAPSIAPSDSAHSSPAVTLASTNALLDAGYLYVATDYLGAGTPGLPPYIAGESAARNMIDIVRAARHLKAAHAGDDYVAWGHSDGGHAALFALKIAERYAPELTPRGVIAGAPPSQFSLFYTVLKDSNLRHELVMAAAGLNAAYGDARAPLDQVLTPAGLALLPELEKGCGAYLQDTLGAIVIDDVLRGDPFTIPGWRELLAADDPQSFTTPVDTPLLIIHGATDEQIPVVSTQILTTHLCDIGQHVERWVYPGETHAGAIEASVGDMISWINARFAAEVPGGVAPADAPRVIVSGCAS
jgi:dipeptidyl aminopeptidase/acylaminoacyl peptidase